MYNISELLVIMLKIQRKKAISDKLKEQISGWVNRNEYQIYLHEDEKVVGIIKTIRDSEIYSEKDCTDVLNWTFSKLNQSIVNLCKLRALIEQDVGDTEALKLWQNEHYKDVKADSNNKNICVLFDEIISATNVNPVKLSLELKVRISQCEYEHNMDMICNQIQKNENIGLSIINLINSKNIVEKINQQAEKILFDIISNGNATGYKNTEKVVLSLSLIAMFNYDRIFYDHVKDVYADLYEKFNGARIEGTIRSILNTFRTNEEIKNRNRVISLVLENSIVPINYLNSFFDFIYDIYSLNFNYELSDSLYDDFKFIFEGLRNNMLSNDDELNIKVTNKSYYFIKSTKQLILSQETIDCVIYLSIMVVKVIDMKMRTDKIDLKNIYFNTGLEAWLESHKRTSDSSRKRKTAVSDVFRSRWEPKFRTINNNIILEPPLHKVKGIYDYNDIRIEVYNHDNMIYEIARPDIREIIGGYEIRIDHIDLLNPLGEIRYFIKAGSEIIYDSKERLFRKVIVFDLEGNEIQNNTDYEGTVLICGINVPKHAKKTYSNDRYTLSSTIVNKNDSYCFDDVIFNFSQMVKPGIIGDVYDNCFLYIAEKNRIPIYKNVECIVFEKEKISSKYEIIINNEPFLMEHFKYELIEKNNVSKYIIYPELTENRKYNIEIRQISMSKSNRVKSFDFIIDSEFSFNEYKNADNSYSVIINSCMTDEVLKYEFTDSSFDDNIFSVEINNNKCRFIIPTSFDFYRLNDSEWRSFDNELWIGDINYQSEIEFLGMNIDKIQVRDQAENVLCDDLTIKSGEASQKISCGFLISYKSSCDYVKLYFLSKDHLIRKILCYMKCFVKPESFSYSYDTTSKSICLSSEYIGKGNVFYVIKDNNGNELCKSDNINSGSEYIVNGISAFKKYKICIYEKAKGLLSSSKKELFSQEVMVYDKEEVVGRTFKIDNVIYSDFIGKDYIEKEIEFSRVYVKVISQTENDNFLGNIFIQTANSEYYMNKINPVQIEICSDLINYRMDAFMDKDGDGLLLDTKNRRILNSLDDKYATDIYIYTLNANGVM